MISGLILAGGEGRRIGGKKPQRHLAGISLLDHAKRLVSRQCRPLFLSVRDVEDAPSGSGLPLVEDVPDLEGPLAGLIAGASASRAAGAGRMLVLACDCPFLPRDLIDRLSHALDRDPEAGIAVAQSGERLHPTISLFRLDRIDELRAIGQCESRLMALYDRLNGVAVEWPILDTGAGPLDPFMNINALEDLRQAERLYPLWARLQKSMA